MNRNRLNRLAAGFAAILIALVAAEPASAQRTYGHGNRYKPLDQRSPVGTAGRWASASGKAAPPYFQPVRFNLPGEGRVIVFAGAARRPVPLATPAMSGLQVGQTYRFRISHMKDFPGVELYPSIEVIDRLHPPPGEALNFPIPIELTAEEIETALTGRLVTKVVYIEQPNRATPLPRKKLETDTIDESFNLLAEADRRGRPTAIIRLGGRVPNLNGESPAFFGTGAPVVVFQPE